MELPEPLFFVITVVWGTVCGLVGGRIRDERTAILRAMAIATGLGLLSAFWALASESEPGWVTEAAVALGLGCAISFLLVLLLGIRPVAD